MTLRCYCRCLACSEVAVVEEAIPADARCLCDGRLRLLGRVGPGKRLVREVDRCPCDGRCTGAPGPSCDCRCGGANHGSGRVVSVLVDAGGVPRVQVSDEASCRARAAEYNAARQPYMERVKQLRARAGRSTEAERRLVDALSSISALRSHKGRMSAFAKMPPPEDFS
mgnify:CR=1 FL=1